MSLIDRQYLSTLNHSEIRKIVTFIRVRDIDAREHDSFEYVKFNFYMNDILVKRNTFNSNDSDAIEAIASSVESISQSMKAIAHFKREMHVINDLRVKLLIEMNILSLETMIANMRKSQLIIDSCDIIVSLSMKPRDERIDEMLKSRE